MAKERSFHDLSHTLSVHDTGETLYGPVLGRGALVGEWEVESTRAQGGFGSVYRCRHVGTGHIAATKVLHAHLVHSTEQVSRFQREIEIVQKLRHPGIVELLEAGQLFDGRPYLVMEWLDTETLEDRLHQHGPLPVSELAALLDDLGPALDAAHAAGVVHRDLKPSNVLVQPTKIIDFGVAKIVDEAATAKLTRTGTRIGTPAYMAPEQFRGEAVSPRTDVYALGVLMFRALTGQVPFSGASAVVLEKLHLGSPPPRASDLAPSNPWSSEVDDVIAGCLEKDSTRRFASAGTAARMLREAATRGKTVAGLRSARVSALGLYLNLGSTDLVPHVEDRLTAAGLSIVTASSSSLLAAAPLPESESEARDLRRRALACARALAAAYPGAVIRLHAAPARVLVLRGAVRVIGGDLADLRTWPVEPGHAGVTASPLALDGL